MEVPEHVQRHLLSKGIDLSKLKPGVHIPKTVPGITIKGSNQLMIPVVYATAFSARAAPLGILSNQREPGAKPKTASFIKKK